VVPDLFGPAPTMAPAQIPSTPRPTPPSILTLRPASPLGTNFLGSGGGDDDDDDEDCCNDSKGNSKGNSKGKGGSGSSDSEKDSIESGYVSGAYSFMSIEALIASVAAAIFFC
jgi:hypothetical protein